MKITGIDPEDIDARGLPAQIQFKLHSICLGTREVIRPDPASGYIKNIHCNACNA